MDKNDGAASLVRSDLLERGWLPLDLHCRYCFQPLWARMGESSGVLEFIHDGGDVRCGVPSTPLSTVARPYDSYRAHSMWERVRANASVTVGGTPYLHAMLGRR